MILGLIITLLYLFYIFTRFKRGVIFVGMTIQFLAYIGTGIPKIKIYTLLVCVILLLYIIQSRKFKRSEQYPKLLSYSSILFILSFVISEIYTRTGHHWMTVISNILTYFFFPFFFWKCLDSKANIKYAIKLLTIVFACSFFFCIAELVFSQNYFTKVISELFVLEDWTEVREDIRFGVKRCNSIFSWYMPFGLFASFCFLFYFILYYKLCNNIRNISILLVFALFMSFVSGSRAVMLGLIAGIVIMCYSRKTVNRLLSPKLLLLIIVFSPLIVTFLDHFFDSIINSDTSKYAVGSNKEMRLNQWAICLPYWLQSPWIGNGRMYIWDVVKPSNYFLYGAESIWFSIFVDYGLFGAFVFLFFLLSCSYYLYKIDKTWICLPVAYLLTLSFSPDSGATYNILLTFTILLIKSNHYLHMGKDSNSKLLTNN